MKKIVILGVTGSVGKQAVEVIEEHPDHFEILAVSANNNIKELCKILDRHFIKHVYITRKEDADLLQSKYPCSKFYHGETLEELAKLDEADVIVNALVGFVGLKPLLAAIRAGKTIALANKEVLVAAGEIVMGEVKRYGATILPVDSEHSAIFQSMLGQDNSSLKRIILTASGGSFVNKSKEELKTVSVEEALAHPTWRMGKKITIDSATMFNKGFEIIEAYWLFGVSEKKIDVVIHRQSIVHSLVEYHDHGMIAQIGVPSMKLPILFALSYPKRLKQKEDVLDLNLNLTFEPIDLERFSSLKLCYNAISQGGSLPCVLNGANEQAVELFLQKKITFIEIEQLVEQVMLQHQVISKPSLEEIYASDSWARAKVRSLSER